MTTNDVKTEFRSCNSAVRRVVWEPPAAEWSLTIRGTVSSTFMSAVTAVHRFKRVMGEMVHGELRTECQFPSF